jgi:hypothetical protein
MARARKRRRQKPAQHVASAETPAPTDKRPWEQRLASRFKPHPLDRRDLLLALFVGVACLALYASTACRTISVGDSAELVTAAAVFGIPHPPGYPTFTLATGAIMRLVPLDRAFAANLIAGAYAAGAVGSLLLLARKVGASRGAGEARVIEGGRGAPRSLRTFSYVPRATETHHADKSMPK